MLDLSKKYKVIYADPPWYFKTYSAKGEDRSAKQHYDTMSFDDIVALNPKQYADKDCVLLMWAIDPMLHKAFELIEAWGFQYKTVGFYWVKTNQGNGKPFTGLGYWTRANPEQCLLATIGKPKRKAKNVPRLIISQRQEHSRKPDEIKQRIERLVDGPYLELFSRTNTDGWDAWGNQMGIFNAEQRKDNNDISNIHVDNSIHSV